MSVGSRVAAACADPREASRLLAGAIAAGELDLAAHLFCRDGCLLTQDATAIRGREEIRGILAQLIAARCEIGVEASSVLRAGEVALATESWRIRFAAPGGAPFEQLRSASLVLREVGETWRIAIAAPWGWPPSP